MTLIYLWVYTLLLVILWWFFIIAKIHAYKFKNFSKRIEKVTKFLLFVLILLSFLWYATIILSSFKSSDIKYDETDFNFNEVNY